MNQYTRAWSEGRTIYVQLHDGRIVGFPADRFRILRSATEEQLTKLRRDLNGYALRWEELDEDITVPGIVAGRDFSYLRSKLFFSDSIVGMRP